MLLTTCAICETSGRCYSAGTCLRLETPAPNPKQAQGDKKVPLVLLDPGAKAQIAEVMASGARKYGAFNYHRSPLRKSTYYSAMARHLDAWHGGEEFDPESGLRHLAHVGANVNILLAVGDKLIDDMDEPSVAPDQRSTGALTVPVSHAETVASTERIAEHSACGTDSCCGTCSPRRAQCRAALCFGASRCAELIVRPTGCCFA